MTTDSTTLARETVAWRIVMGAFAIFLMGCGITAYAVQWYIWQSHAEMTTTVEVARGTARISEPGSERETAVVEPSAIENDSLISTDSTSQAVISVSDPRTGDVIASITLFNDARIHMVSATGPRFPLNQSPYSIDLEHIQGQAEITLIKTNNGINFDLHTPHGSVDLIEAGQYFVDDKGDDTLIVSRRGTLIYRLEQEDTVYIASDNQQFVLSSNRMRPDSSEENTVTLVENSQFEGANFNAWRAYHTPGFSDGRHRAVIFKGRDAALIDRSQQNSVERINTHGETGLYQELNLDVDGFSYLEMRVSFLIEEQSLSVCGQFGSECPVMVWITYTAADGAVRDYRTGFFAHVDPGAPYPLACSTCRTEHQRVNMGTWYTFESGNLMTTLPEDLRPTQIHRVQVYASGHAYKVYVSELNILAAE